MIKKEVANKLAALITAGFGLVAALAWNDAVQFIFREFLGARNSIAAMFTYAILVTIVAVVVTVWIGKLSEKPNNSRKNKKKK